VQPKVKVVFNNLGMQSYFRFEHSDEQARAFLREQAIKVARSPRVVPLSGLEEGVEFPLVAAAIKVGGDGKATHAEVEDAARRANAHEFIEKLPELYETFVGERGVKLSGGQQQRLAIARAILASPQILILDEATSNQDTESEQLTHASMVSLQADRTTFVIAHRLSTVRRADLILLMADGSVVERGTHDELMQAGGEYRAMVQRQMETEGALG
jgi:ABC-type multidrug transport system fused ATPase/permease subunit